MRSLERVTGGGCTERVDSRTRNSYSSEGAWIKGIGRRVMRGIWVFLRLTQRVDLTCKIKL